MRYPRATSSRACAAAWIVANETGRPSVHVLGRVAQVDLGAVRVEQVAEDVREVRRLGDLREQQREQPRADDEVVRLRDLRQLAVALVEHLGHDRELPARPRLDVAQVEQGQQRPGVGHVRVAVVGLAQDDHVREGRHVERVERGPVGGAVHAAGRRDVRQPQDLAGLAGPAPAATPRRTSDPGATYWSSSRMIAAPRRFQPRTRIRSGPARTGRRAGSRRGPRARAPPRPGVTRGPRPGAPGRRRRGAPRPRRAPGGPPPSRTMPTGMAPVMRATASPNVRPASSADRRDVELVAGEVEQLEVDRGEAGLAARLGDDPGDQLVRQEQVHLVAGDEPRDPRARPVAHLGHDPVRLLRGGPGAR